MQMTGRKFSAGSEYRFGFNGKEKDDDTYGNGNEYDYGDRIYNPRIGRWLSLDPLQKNIQMKPPIFTLGEILYYLPILMAEIE